MVTKTDESATAEEYPDTAKSHRKYAKICPSRQGRTEFGPIGTLRHWPTLKD